MKMDSKTLFESAPIPKAFFTLTIPSMLGKLVILLYSLVDTWFVAATNNTALVAAVSICAPVLTVMTGIGDIFGIGGASLISRLFGKGENEKAREVSALCFWATLFCSILVQVAMLVFSVPVLKLLGADETTMEYALTYYRILLIGAPATILSVIPLNLLRTEGLANASMIGSTVGAVVHLIVIVILMWGFDFGIAGAAWSTVIGNTATLLVYLWYMLRKTEWITISIKAFHLHGHILWEVLSIGIPAALTNLMNSFVQTVTNRYLLLYGTEKLAAYGISGKLSMIAMMAQISFSFGAQPLIGYNYVKKDRTRLKGVLKFNYLFMTAVCGAFTIILSIFAPQLMGLFMDDSTIVAIGATTVRIQAAGFVFSGLVMVSSCVFRAAGKAKEALLLVILRQGVIYVAVLIIANALFGYNGVIAAQPVADIITAITTMFMLKPLLKE